MNEHTPSPWKAYQMSKRTWEIRGPDEFELIVCRTNAGTWGTPYAKTDKTIAANARLIAAAPETVQQRDELLAACKILLQWASKAEEEMAIEGGDCRSFAELSAAGHVPTEITQAQAAIAKAEGRSQEVTL